MNTRWDHPSLGHLSYDRGRDAWIGRVDVPGFKVFTHTWDDDVPGRCDLIFETRDEQTTPSEAAVEMALKLLANAERFSRVVVDTLWSEFNGRGPKSSMWWQGNLNQVIENGDGEDVPPLTNPDALLGWMHPNSIIVHSAGSNSQESPIIEVACSAVFEVEHGVGILTDGLSILGTGYIDDMVLYDQ